MTINAAGFYAAALVVVVAALACVVVPSPRQAVVAGLACLIGVALLLGVSGAYVLAAAQLLVPAAAVALVWYEARRYGVELLAGRAGGPAHLWPVGLGVAVACAALFLLALLTHADEWAPAGTGGGALLSVVHWAEPVGVVAAACLAVLGVVGVLLIGGESADERAHDAALDERRRKQERIERRRTDRGAARRKNGVGRA